MEVNQVILVIPPDIQIGLDSGLLVRFGGVIRDTKGSIRDYLEDAEDKEEEEEENKLEKIAENMDDNIEENKDDSKKYFKVLGIAVLAATVIGIIIYYFLKKNNRKQKVIDQFNEDFSTYLLAAQKEELNSEILEKLHRSIELVRGLYKNQKKIKGFIDLKNFSLFVDILYGYTLELAAKNGMTEKGITRSKKDLVKNNIIDLQRYVEIQQKIFKRGA